MAKSKKRKLEEGLFKIINEWKKEEPENFEMNNRMETGEQMTMGLLSFLLRTNKVKGVEI
tara:strand:+ start:1965 stop:2144 length:180 start_codon:yes stop_codon:yes gene_type:complete